MSNADEQRPQHGQPSRVRIAYLYWVWRGIWEMLPGLYCAAPHIILKN